MSEPHQSTLSCANLTLSHDLTGRITEQLRGLAPQYYKVNNHHQLLCICVEAVAKLQKVAKLHKAGMLTQVGDLKQSILR